MMANQDTKRRSGSRREREHAEMLEAALARPGIREVMYVYRGWQEKDRGLDLNHPLILVVKWRRRFHGTRVAR